MEKKNSNKENLNPDQQSSQAAQKAAESDITEDLDLTPPPDPAADLDEGELANLEGED